MSRIVETLVPRRLGIPFRWLLASSWTSNLGDGIAIAAGPLLIASLTDDARLVAAERGGERARQVVRHADEDIGTRGVGQPDDEDVGVLSGCCGERDWRQRGRHGGVPLGYLKQP